MLKFGLSLFIVVLTGCMSVPVGETTSLRDVPQKNFIVLSQPFDSVWSKLFFFISTQEYSISIKQKTKADGLVLVEYINVPLTYIGQGEEEKAKLSEPVARAESRKKVSNFDLLYPRTGNIEISFAIEKEGEASTSILVVIKNECLLTSYIEDGYVVECHIPNVKIKSTGVIEKKLFKFLSN